MKKTITLIITAIMLITALVSCGGKNYDTISFDIAELGEYIASNAAFGDELIKLENSPYSFDGASFVTYGGTGATPEEIIVVEAADADSAEKALETMNERIADQKKTFTDYNQQEKPKLNDAVVMTAGKYAIMCVSADNAAAEQLITEWLDSKVK